ncbi:uncharacterized protein BDR25DRAFT_363013 [Lindgomyces ingoldianus]|uniref:Uncharacterized protein n=1 Tax=Lindgomyces ingoldianus TaxID=673940 RepID=A0ACB6Q8M1_9PLEO|nr:uncharacterized protein BDR25DRAFT_363013 [Lindgomyces ingoldianus]KAF2463293.1 hypothetical protein BDR25DRAFT_363013 [Lindgomyces ingoldianus]
MIILKDPCRLIVHVSNRLSSKTLWVSLNSPLVRTAWYFARVKLHAAKPVVQVDGTGAKYCIHVYPSGFIQICACHFPYTPRKHHGSSRYTFQGSQQLTAQYMLRNLGHNIKICTPFPSYLTKSRSKHTIIHGPDPPHIRSSFIHPKSNTAYAKSPSLFGRARGEDEYRTLKHGSPKDRVPSTNPSAVSSPRMPMLNTTSSDMTTQDGNKKSISYIKKLGDLCNSADSRSSGGCFLGDIFGFFVFLCCVRLCVQIEGMRVRANEMARKSTLLLRLVVKMLSQRGEFVGPDAGWSPGLAQFGMAPPRTGYLDGRNELKELQRKGVTGKHFSNSTIPKDKNKFYTNSGGDKTDEIFGKKLLDTPRSTPADSCAISSSFRHLVTKTTLLKEDKEAWGFINEADTSFSFPQMMRNDEYEYKVGDSKHV